MEVDAGNKANGAMLAIMKSNSVLRHARLANHDGVLISTLRYRTKSWFLGTTQVDQPKGIEVVKEAIQKLQFNQQLKKSETKDAAKCKKVEITISVDGVAIQVGSLRLRDISL
ncbi:PTB domain-containing adapter protein ced-6 [Eumeta japonica]|uniref:PTB domain-containing adapter protein ced-6 n=1 Tax=Eumeta variegata TaxID=151549 RepID=A0A4C1TNX2_EUMVA|nr:PTB domain-containing adapter protein ced-6 [Eumeta japonica]